MKPQLDIQANCTGVTEKGDTKTVTFTGHISGPTKAHSVTLNATVDYVGTDCPFVEGNAYRIAFTPAE